MKKIEKNQQNLIELIRQKPSWAGGNMPNIMLHTIEIDKIEIDIVVIKQSNNTPYYLMEDYKKQGKPLFKGAIYTRRGDTNTPRTETANVYEAELLWKRRFGMLQSPSQRGLFYLKDVENWELVEIEGDKTGRKAGFYFYQLDPDYTIHFEDVEPHATMKHNTKISNINDERIGAKYFYLFSFFNVSYHDHFSEDEKVIFYYKDIPLFSSHLEIIDEGKTTVVPPEYSSNAFYIRDSFRHLLYELMFALRGFNYSSEAKVMLERVIPIYDNYDEQQSFDKYISDKGFTHFDFILGPITGEASERLNTTKIESFSSESILPGEREHFAKKVLSNSNCVYNFANTSNKNYDSITQNLKKGKMLVDWLNEWRS